jgi:SAM-dependent methyltransferase
MSEQKRGIARGVAHRYLSQNDPLGWFEELYVQGVNDVSIIPWADLVPNPSLMTWLDSLQIIGNGKRALTIGCGLGDDAEELALKGFDTTAFDISNTAIALCHKRFPKTRVSYEIMDLFSAPKHWQAEFDFVLESYTLQVLPPELQQKAIHAISNFVKPQGMLLVITRGRGITDPEGEMPWPVTRDTLNEFRMCSLTESSFEDYMDNEKPPVRRFRVLYTKSKYSSNRNRADGFR